MKKKLNLNTVCAIGVLSGIIPNLVWEYILLTYSKMSEFDTFFNGLLCTYKVSRKLLTLMN